MAAVNRLVQIKMIGDGLQIIGIVVHVVPVAGLTRATMSAAITRNDAIAFAKEKKHLRVPIIRAQWPSMTEDNRLSCAPVFVVNLRSIFCCDRAHNCPFLLMFYFGFHRYEFSMNCLKFRRYSSAFCADIEGSKRERNFRVISVALSERGSNETTPSPTPSAIVRQAIRRSGIWRMTSITPRCSLPSRMLQNEKWVSSIRSTWPSDLINLGSSSKRNQR